MLSISGVNLLHAKQRTAEPEAHLAASAPAPVSVYSRELASAISHGDRHPPSPSLPASGIGSRPEVWGPQAQLVNGAPPKRLEALLALQESWARSHQSGQSGSDGGRHGRPPIRVRSSS
ncbi:hypothetical protein CcaCcLH18_02117 [Colletotrichum camelliae]|nr:hypothetical protein CcaCcLH18_02117 [Colletotrichum camelliae]